jgi:hexosaminidase
LYRRLFVISDQLDEQGLQHIADYERGLRRISDNEFTSIKNLTDVLTPVKGYKKLFAQMMRLGGLPYQTTPLIQVSDIVFVDSK